jgi:AcrR family transcriptional regulator
MNKDTKEKILDAAEKLFSKNGIGITSLRTIMTEAKVNIAAIHYHFGSREGLIQAVYERKIEPINQRRMELLTKFEEQAMGEAVSVSDLVHSFVKPILEHLNDPEHEEIIKGLFSRVHSEPAEVSCIRDKFETILRRFSDAFSKSLPQLSEGELNTRFAFMMGVLTMGFMNNHILNKKLAVPGETPTSQEMINRIIRYVTAGFEAPPAENEN